MVMPKQLTILVDMDDVCEDLLEGWLNWLNKTYETYIVKEEITEWSMSKCLKKYIDSNKFKNEDIYKPLYDPEFWNTLNPLPDAVDGLKLLNDKNIVFIATNSHYKTIRPKVDNCLFKYFPFLYWDQIITIKDKYLINADVLIDDNYDNIFNFVHANENRIGLLMNAPYNKNIEDYNERIIRVNNWKEIIYEIERIKNKQILE